MSNPNVKIKLDKIYNLKFGMGAMYDFEELTGTRIMDLDDNLSFTTCAQLLFVMISQENESLTLKQVCKLVDESDITVEEVLQTITRAIEAAFTIAPEPAPGKGPNGLKPE